jgi:hypothetical protein
MSSNFTRAHLSFSYLETRGADSFVRPWFWIMWLFLGPMLMSVSFQSYIFTMTRTLVRCEALLVQLVFDHSLRIRFKAEAEESDEKEKKPAATSSSTSSVTNDSTEQEGSTDSATVLGTEEASSVTKKDSPAEAKAPKKADNLVGKLNNLITNDMNNITGARDFLMISVFSAVHSTKETVDPISSIPGPTRGHPRNGVPVQNTWMECLCWLC